jgi:hypothetical protein
MLWVGSLPGKEYNPQSKFRHEYREPDNPWQLKRIGDMRPGAGWEGINLSEPKPTHPAS